MLKFLVLVIVTSISLPFIHLAEAAATDLTDKCRHGVLAEIYVAHAALYKKNGSTQEYETALASAKRQGAILGYPDYAIDLMVSSEMGDVTDQSSIDNSLSGLSDNGLVIEPLVEDCLKKPNAYIRNY